GIVILTIPVFNHSTLIQAGKAAERAWIFANQQHVAVHPLLSTAFFFGRLTHGKAKDLPQHVADKLSLLRQRFLKVLSSNAGYQGTNEYEAFVMKISIAPDADSRSLRKHKAELFDR